MSDKHVALASHIRRLCSLAVEPHLVIPHVIEAARHIVGADWGMFFYADEHYAVSDVCSENEGVYSLLPTYFANIHNTSRQQVLASRFPRRCRGRGFDNSAHYDDALLASDMYATQAAGVDAPLSRADRDGRHARWGSLRCRAHRAVVRSRKRTIATSNPWRGIWPTRCRGRAAHAA